MPSSLEPIQVSDLSILQPTQEPADCSNSGSYNSNPPPGLMQEYPIHSKTITSGSDGTSPPSDSVDERKRRRMMSNRESARRSRMRKQKHLENLRNQLNRLRIGIRELLNRVLLTVHLDQLIRRQNERLRLETVVLRRRLCDIRQVLLLRNLQQHFNPSALPCNDITLINGPLSQYSLIT